MIISRFENLHNTEVQETLDLPWLQFVAFITRTPGVWRQDHGGWSPVLFEPSRRLKANVKKIDALVFDFDGGVNWNDVCFVIDGLSFVIYTTKSHTEDDPHLRVIIPLELSASVDEHARAWTYYAARFNARGCKPDSQCRDASRFWYDTSLPPGGKWRAESHVGTAAVIPPEDTRPAVTTKVDYGTRDQRERRAVAYINKVSPAISGQQGHNTLWNAVSHALIGFDLEPHVVRSIILEHYNPRCVPPWREHDIEKKIKDVCDRSDRQRGYLLTDMRTVTTNKEASESIRVKDETSGDWRGGLLTKNDGTVRKAVKNIFLIVRNHHDYYCRWSWNEMTQSPCLDGERLSDTIIDEVRAIVEQDFGFTPAKEDTLSAIVGASQERRFHPIREYLRSLVWDGVPRLTGMAAKYLAAGGPLYSEMVRKWMIGACARALKPGCKLDTALMLVGDQGVRKSTFFSVLGGDWHSDTFVDITNKDSFIQIHASWIYELSELENVVHGKAESRLKAWITSTHDIFRPPFGKTADRFARSVALCGTTNRREFLTDDTGSRRFWIVPVAVDSIDTETLYAERNQLWAEAFSAAEAGEQYWLTKDEDYARESNNSKFEETDSWESAISNYLRNPAVSVITTAEILTNCLEIEIGRQARADQMRAAKALTRLGWKHQLVTTDGVRRRIFTRGKQ